MSLPVQAARKRMTRKQAPPPNIAIPEPALAALADEAWSELTALSDDARRKHVHWVHVRTRDPSHRQPETFTREQFWRHMEKVYKDVYPSAANRTGSILLFGAVAKEKHQLSGRDQERAEHHHCLCYTSEKHYWKVVARRSFELGVKLHAAVHDGYSMMYAYVRCPTAKKPMTELDHTLWHSEDHPQGDVLTKLLNAGFSATRWLRKRHRDDGDGTPRFRATDLFQLVRRANLRYVVDLRARAHEDAAGGSPGLAEFCTTHREEELQTYLDNAWAVHDAPQRALASAGGRVGKLRDAAAAGACTCGGVWTAGVTFVLQYQGDDAPRFCHDVLRALTLGAARGVNMAALPPPTAHPSQQLIGAIYACSCK